MMFKNHELSNDVMEHVTGGVDLDNMRESEEDSEWEIPTIECREDGVWVVSFKS